MLNCLRINYFKFRTYTYVRNIPKCQFNSLRILYTYLHQTCLIVSERFKFCTTADKLNMTSNSYLSSVLILFAPFQSVAADEDEEETPMEASEEPSVVEADAAPDDNDNDVDDDDEGAPLAIKPEVGLSHFQ